jgi:hypothetical protein
MKINCCKLNKNKRSQIQKSDRKPNGNKKGKSPSTSILVKLKHISDRKFAVFR